VHVAHAVQKYILDLILATRSHRHIALGASPRAGVALLGASQAAAAIDGRAYATPDDIKNVAPLVLPHRLLLQPQAEIDGVRTSSVIDDLLKSVAVPKSETETP